MIVSEGWAPAKGRKEPLDWPVLGGLLVLHVGAVAALFQFSWFALTVATFLYWLSCSVGISLGFHRLLSHRSFVVAPWLRTMILAAGCLALQGRPFYWAAVHRLHHRDPDGPNDPHSPRHGLWWAHAAWVVRQNTGGTRRDHVIGDLKRDASLVRLDRYCPWLQLASVIGVWGLGEVGRAAGLETSGVSCVLWGIGMRTVFAYHATWLVNSATHRWGYATYRTQDDARNLWWVALLTFGEGWHNNHHAFPYSARIGHRWFELDPTWILLRLLAALGLVSHVRSPKIRETVSPGPAEASAPEPAPALPPRPAQ